MDRTRHPCIGVTVITGYLGSGKTTLLSGVLSHPDLRDTAVIVNEFGEVGLDHLLVECGSEDVVVLDSGCLCCTMSDSLADTLADLMFRRVRGEIPSFRRVIVETSGLADPAPILHCLLTDRLVTQYYRLEVLITVVDAVHGLRQLQTTAEAVKQVAMADQLAISKTDVVDSDQTLELRAQLKGLNPHARIVTTQDCLAGAPAELMEMPATRNLHLTANADSVSCPRDGNGQEEVHAHGSISTFTFEIARPATWAGYDFWVRQLMETRSGDLLRMKGVLEIERRTAPYFIQSVQHVFSSPMPMKVWPWPDRLGRIVFIARDIDRTILARSLRNLHKPAGIRYQLTPGETF